MFRALGPALLFLASAAFAGPVTVPSATLAHLRRGVDVSDWFIYEEKARTLSEKDFHQRVLDEASRIHSMGFDHVRLSVDPDLPGKDPGFYEKLKFTLDILISDDLSIIIDIHPNAGFFTFSEKLVSDPATYARFSGQWRELARFFRRFDPGRVILEILNEPTVTDRDLWYRTQAKLAEVIRAEAPRHTLIAMGANYSSLEELLPMKPLADGNVIYDFHFYTPGIFTHQTTTWAVPYYSRLKGIPYPFGPKDDAAILAQIPKGDHEARRLFHERYEGQRWDGERIASVLSQARDWSAKWKVPVICGEFGAYRANTRAEYRAAWMHDVRKALEKFGIGWTLWNYEGDFGLMSGSMNGPRGALVPDPLILKGLGLRE